MQSDTCALTSSTSPPTSNRPMRIRFHITEETVRSDIGGRFTQALHASLARFADTSITDTDDDAAAPHLMHIIGAFDIHAAQALFKAHKQLIPVVYSPLGGLNEWEIKAEQLKKRTLLIAYQKRMLRLADTIHVTSNVEKKAVEAIGKPRLMAVILNPVVTTQITETALGDSFHGLYCQTIERHEQEIHADIDRRTAFLDDRPAMQTIIRKILYLRYRLRQGSLPQPLLDDLAHTMIEADYDEDQMADVLREQGLYQLATQLEQVMAENSGLTEGFMPIPPSTVKSADVIRRHIENNQ